MQGAQGPPAAAPMQHPTPGGFYFVQPAPGASTPLLPPLSNVHGNPQPHFMFQTSAYHPRVSGTVNPGVGMFGPAGTPMMQPYNPLWAMRYVQSIHEGLYTQCILRSRLPAVSYQHAQMAPFLMVQVPPPASAQHSATVPYMPLHIHTVSNPPDVLPPFLPPKPPMTPVRSQLQPPIITPAHSQVHSTLIPDSPTPHATWVHQPKPVSNPSLSPIAQQRTISGPAPLSSFHRATEKSPLESNVLDNDMSEFDKSPGSVGIPNEIETFTPASWEQLHGM